MEKSKEYGAKIRIYKWDVRLPQIEHDEGLIVWIKPVSYTVTHDNDEDKIKNNAIEPDMLLFHFQLEKLLSVQGRVSDYIRSNYCINIDALSKPDSPKVVVMLYISLKIVEGKAEVCEPVVNAPFDDRLVEHALSSLCAKFDLRKDNSRLVQVPPLEKFQLCDVGGSLSLGGDRCAICLEEFSSEKGKNCKGTRKTSCSHIFHGDCIGQWLWNGQSCPLCRSPLVGHIV